MKLISMTNFVLEQKPQNAGRMAESYLKISNYANFLTEKLHLWMFVPCDNDGKVLKEPKWKKGSSRPEFSKKNKQYSQAKEKVLFEECSLTKKKHPYGDECYYEVRYDDMIIWVSWATSTTVERIMPGNIILTKSAQKQIGL